ncbi:hypothetical protein M9Y10_000005 [Tritrichomonas musculus]|uniref:Uncharacterized protein n=1 Tax=Tritrichomonas musculus TaxID=1915356 RepID=A0ABR2L3L9_9EUKA
MLPAEKRAKLINEFVAKAVATGQSQFVVSPAALEGVRDYEQRALLAARADDCVVAHLDALDQALEGPRQLHARRVQGDDRERARHLRRRARGRAQPRQPQGAERREQRVRRDDAHHQVPDEGAELLQRAAHSRAAPRALLSCPHPRHGGEAPQQQRDHPGCPVARVPHLPDTQHAVPDVAARAAHAQGVRAQALSHRLLVRVRRLRPPVRHASRGLLPGEDRDSPPVDPLQPRLRQRARQRQQGQQGEGDKGDIAQPVSLAVERIVAVEGEGCAEGPRRSRQGARELREGEDHRPRDIQDLCEPCLLPPVRRADAVCDVRDAAAGRHEPVPAAPDGPQADEAKQDAPQAHNAAHLEERA